MVEALGGTAGSKRKAEPLLPEGEEERACKRASPVPGAEKENLGMNHQDEATLPLNEESDTSVQVLTTPELEQLADPKAASERMIQIVDALVASGLGEAENWLEQYEATTFIRQIVQFHLENYMATVYGPERLAQTLQYLTRGVESLRSTQSRNALFAIGELFDHLPAECRVLSEGPVLESLVEAIILKSVNDKRFISSAGEVVLQSMVENAPCIAQLKTILKHSSSKSSKVCAVAAKYSSICLRGITATGLPIEDEQVLSLLIEHFAELEESRSVDAKKPAQESLRILQNALGPARFALIVEKALGAYSAANVLSVVSKASAKESKPQSLRDLMAEKRKEMAAKR